MTKSGISDFFFIKILKICFINKSFNIICIKIKSNKFKNCFY